MILIKILHTVGNKLSEHVGINEGVWSRNYQVCMLLLDIWCLDN